MRKYLLLKMCASLFKKKREKKYIDNNKENIVL